MLRAGGAWAAAAVEEELALGAGFEALSAVVAPPDPDDAVPPLVASPEGEEAAAAAAAAACSNGSPPPPPLALTGAAGAGEGAVIIALYLRKQMSIAKTCCGRSSQVASLGPFSTVATAQRQHGTKEAAIVARRCCVVCIAYVRLAVCSFVSVQVGTENE